MKNKKMEKKLQKSRMALEKNNTKEKREIYNEFRDFRMIIY